MSHLSSWKLCCKPEANGRLMIATVNHSSIKMGKQKVYVVSDQLYSLGGRQMMNQC